MIDSNYNPLLIELNTNPALFLDTKVQSDVIPEVMKKTLDLVLSVNEDQEKLGKELLKDNPFNVQEKGFDVLVNEVNGFELL